MLVIRWCEWLSLTLIFCWLIFSYNVRYLYANQVNSNVNNLSKVSNRKPSKTVEKKSVVKARPKKRWPGQGNPCVERVRKCIIQREARGSYRVADPTGRWFGAYQFQLETSNSAARRMKKYELVGVPANKWTKDDQDAAFYIIYNFGRGKKHWYCSKQSCF